MRTLSQYRNNLVLINYAFNIYRAILKSNKCSVELDST